MRVEITTNNVQKMQVATKVDDDTGELIARVSVEYKVPIDKIKDIARLLNLQVQKKRQPLYFIIGSPQAEMDLEFITIKSQKIESPPAPLPPPPEKKMVECPACHGKGSELNKATKIDVACSVCKGVGSIPDSRLASAIFNTTKPLEAATPSGNGTQEPKRRSRRTKAQMAEAAAATAPAATTA